MAKLLLVEDDHHIQELYEVAFSLSDHEVTLLEDMSETLAFVEKENPDLVLLDLILPRAKGETPVYEQYVGFDILHIMKVDERLKDIPVVIFSNLKDKPVEDKAMRLGALDFVVKSEIRPRDMLNYVEKQLAKIGKK